MEPSFLRTIPEALDFAAERVDAGFIFIDDRGREQDHRFADLALGSRKLAAALQERGVRKGDRVALILPTADEFIPAFLGVSRAGAIPVPLYPPMGMGQLGGYLDHARHIVCAARASHVITTGQIKAVLGKLYDYTKELRSMLTMADLADGDAASFREPTTAIDDICFLQFTSGSTSAPKGVIVTHENLAQNSYAIMRHGLASDERDRGISWLPLFHDMGLIGFVLAPMAHRVPVTFLSPLTFLKRPVSWLETISKHRGTITYGPNFAYALAEKRIREGDLAGVDLSCVRVAGCGAEPIQAETLRRFARRFSAQGFREEAFVPSYGMAEHTLAIAFSRGVPTDTVKAEPLWNEGRAEPAQAEADEDTIELVSCGRSFPGHEIRIVDPATGMVAPERTVGEIQIKGPSVTAGYFENEATTRETIDADGWLSTGDLGYLADGATHICGRKKDILIVNGRNYYPQDLEWAAGAVDGVRTGNAIAFATYREGLGREAIVILAETRNTEALDHLVEKVKQTVYEASGLMVDEVALIEPGTLPKTSSGKVQRAKAREQFEAGTLRKEEAEGRAKIAGRVVQSQLSHLRLRVFGPRRS